MKTATVFLSVCAAFLAVCLTRPATAQNTAADCAPRDGMTFICGLENAEDLVPLGDSGWIVVSSFHGGPGNVPGFGPLSIVNSKSHAVVRLYPRDDAKADWDRTHFPDCDMPPSNISSHGLDVRANGSGGFRVFAVNHGGRESIEIFDVTSPGANARVTWRGCLLVPKDVLANGVASLPGGRVVVSGQNVTIWSPRSGWRGYTPGVIKRANGVIASPDGRWLYINGSDDYTVNLVATDGRMEDRKVLITSEFAHADNIRRGSDGKLYTAGTYVKPEDAKACFTSKLCNVPTVVIVTDPKTNIARELIRIPPSVGAFGAGTVALRVGNELWIGASKGDRVAIIPMPK